MQKLLTMFLLCLFIGDVFADSGNPKVIDMLKRNTIVNAAVAQAKEFSGAKTCEYTVESNEPKQFEKGSTFDYSAQITCRGDEAQAFIHVTGRMFSPSDGPQALTLSIDFAG